MVQLGELVSYNGLGSDVDLMLLENGIHVYCCQTFGHHLYVMLINFSWKV
jgi:hypothetical protein